MTTYIQLDQAHLMVGWLGLMTHVIRGLVSGSQNLPQSGRQLYRVSAFVPQNKNRGRRFLWHFSY